MGRGFYEYHDGKPTEKQTVELEPTTRELVFERVVSQLVNEGCFAVDEGVASPGDIDSAMRVGLNHPRGPFEWMDELGAERVEATLDALHAGNDERYRAAPLLRRLASRDQPN